MKRYKGIKARISILLISLCLVFGGLVLYHARSIFAFQDAVTDNNQLVVNGSQIEVKQTQIHDEIEVTFTFKTLGDRYNGFAGGTYAVQWDPTQMDLVANSLGQDASTIFNYDWSSFTVNAQPGVEGMVLVHNSGATSQEKTLKMRFTNLFKDGNFNRSAEVKVINRSEDLFVVGIADQEVGEIATNVVIRSAIITAVPSRIEIIGEDSVIKGTGTSYQADVTNAISNAVTWSIQGQTSPDTSINEQGILYVSDKEEAKQIEVIATLKDDSSVFASKVIQIMDKTYTITNIEIPVSNASTDTTASKKEIEEIAGKNKKAKITVESNIGQTAVIEVDIEKYTIPKEIMSAEGVVQAGEYSISYTLKLPYLIIDASGKVNQDFYRETNLLGESGITMFLRVDPKKTSEETNNTSPPSKDTNDINKIIDERAKNYVATGDTTKIQGLLMSGFLSIIGWMYIVTKKRGNN